jgi:small-conductance mechanosensitive channel
MWETVFWGNSLARWTIAAAVTVGFVLALRTGVSAVAVRLKRAAAGTETDIDDLVVDLVDRTKLTSVVVVAVWTASYVLVLPSRATGGIRAALVLGVLVQFGFWASALVDYFVTRYRNRVEDNDPGVATAMGAVGFVARVAVWSVLGLIALDTLGVDVTALIAGLGIGGIAVALAVQNVLGDLFASVSIILDKPFVVGDFIVLGDYMGTVEHVGLKTTQIRALSGEQLIISNCDLLSSRIRNFKRMQERRVTFEAGVVYGTPAESLRKIPQNHQGDGRVPLEHALRPEPFQGVRFIGAHVRNGLLHELPDYNAYMDTQEAINLELYERFETLGIEFAYPTQTLILRDARDGDARMPRLVGHDHQG